MKRNDGSTEMGNAAEQRFYNIVSKLAGVIVSKASHHQDRIKHWDYLLRKEGKEYKFEVKAMKKANRWDDKPVPHLVYVEFLNVIGLPGWIYGEADYIALEQPNGFLCVDRTELVEVAESLVKNEWANRPTLYQCYRRKDRPQEKVSVLHIDDLKQIKNKFLLIEK
jgi:hypothetical protein